MAVPTTTSAPTPYSIGAIEGAVVAFVGSFASALTLVGVSLQGASEIGLISAAAYLGYHAYQSS